MPAWRSSPGLGQAQDAGAEHGGRRSDDDEGQAARGKQAEDGEGRTEDHEDRAGTKVDIEGSYRSG